jgi:hypothetical protein
MPRAEEGLLRNARYWEEHYSHDEADRWYVEFAKAIEAIPDHPLQHPLAHENDRFPFELRALHFGISSRPTHRALFTIRPDAIVVIAVRGAAEQDATLDDL